MYNNSPGVMRDLARKVDNNISPQTISNLSSEVIEQTVKSLNHCHKKAKLLHRLAMTFCMEPVPSTSAGLLKVHGIAVIIALSLPMTSATGIGPAISEVILCVAFRKKRRQCRESEYFDLDENKHQEAISAQNSLDIDSRKRSTTDIACIDESLERVASCWQIPTSFQVHAITKGGCVDSETLCSNALVGQELEDVGKGKFENTSK